MYKILSLLLTLTTACVSLQATLDRWIGQKDTDLVSAWGAPARETVLSDSSRVLTWRRSYSGQDGSAQVCEESFTINRVGTVTKWSAVNCPKYIRR